MSATPTVQARTTLTNGSTTLYTVTTGKTAIITSLVLCNTDTVQHTATVNFDSVAVLSAVVLAANETKIIDMRQVLASTKTVTGLADVSSKVTIHISGVEL